MLYVEYTVQIGCNFNLEMWWLIGGALEFWGKGPGFRYLPQWAWCDTGSLCHNVENLRVERETYPWGKKVTTI